MGMAASQARLLLLTAKQDDLEFRAQQISQKRLILAQRLEEISNEYENATSNRQMKISLYLRDVANETTNIPKTTNLTYAALVSGTIANLDSQYSGIQASERTADQEYTCNTFYRLRDADGAIVVSDVSEIPTVVVKNTNSELNSGTGMYEKKEVGNNNELTTTHNYLIVDSSKETDLTKALYYKGTYGTEIKNGITYNADPNSGIVCIDDGNELSYYNYKTGSQCNEEEAQKYNGSTLKKDTFTIVQNKESIPPSQTVAETTNGDGLTVGADGKYTVTINGNSIRYVVDNALKYGTTDANGSTDGPNYLQDCLRNGKYLLQKATINKDEKEENRVTWNSLSWDATTNISDSYYTEDDDRAKAKYDRLQAEIQNQDKKLELELDDIETQRSAVKTEKESVGKVISDNVENTFNTFS